MAITSANQLELLQTAEAVAREKMIDPSLVVEAMEERSPEIRVYLLLWLLLRSNSIVPSSYRTVFTRTIALWEDVIRF